MYSIIARKRAKVHKPEEVVIFDGVPRILAAYKIAGWRIVGVTNQGGVALGHLSFDDVMSVNMRTHLLCNQMFDKITICVHHPDAPDPMMGNCWCRKPRIGMLVDTGIDMSAAFDEIYPPHWGLFVGDRPEDEQCAENAGLPFMAASEWRGGGWEHWL